MGLVLMLPKKSRVSPSLRGSKSLMILRAKKLKIEISRVCRLNKTNRIYKVDHTPKITTNGLTDLGQQPTKTTREILRNRANFPQYKGMCIACRERAIPGYNRFR